MRLFYLYLLIIIFFFVYIRYHGYQLWFKMDGHVTPKYALQDKNHKQTQIDLAKNDKIDFENWRVRLDSEALHDGHASKQIALMKILNGGVGQSKLEGSSSLLNADNDSKYQETKLKSMNGRRKKLPQDSSSLRILYKGHFPKTKVAMALHKGAVESGNIAKLEDVKSAPLLNKANLPKPKTKILNETRVGQGEMSKLERIVASLNDDYLLESNSVLEQFKSSTKTVHRLLETLKRQWKRYTKLDTDWKAILEPCKNDMNWRTRRTTDQQTNIATSSITTNIQPAREFSSIHIRARTDNGENKTLGGDALRVYVRGPSALVAKVIDYNNGSYDALFLVQEPGNYTVYIVLDFSGCDGLRDPPSDWFIQGMSVLTKVYLTVIKCQELFNVLKTVGN